MYLAAHNTTNSSPNVLSLTHCKKGFNTTLFPGGLPPQY